MDKDRGKTLVNQDISGTGHQVAGRDFIKHVDIHTQRKEPIFDPNDPNVITCPFKCGKRTWYNSDKCWNCDSFVKQYFIDEDRDNRRKEFKQTRFSEGVLAIVFSACIYMISSYLIENIAVYTKFFSFPFFMMGVVMIGQSIRT